METSCPACGRKVGIDASDEGTHSYRVLDFTGPRCWHCGSGDIAARGDKVAGCHCPTCCRPVEYLLMPSGTRQPVPLDDGGDWCPTCESGNERAEQRTVSRVRGD